LSEFSLSAHSFQHLGHAMHEYENIQFNDTAKILQQAYLRRTADLGLWLKQYFRKSREVRTRTATSPAPNSIVSVKAPIGRQAV
jgi:hypothetical protein